MLLAFFTDWGGGEQLLAICAVIFALVLMVYGYVFRVDDRAALVIVGPVALVLALLLIMTAEGSRRDTLAVRHELSKLDGAAVVEIDLSGSEREVEIRKGDCHVQLGIKDNGVNAVVSRWEFAFAGNDDFMPIDTGFQSKVNAFCKLVGN